MTGFDIHAPGTSSEEWEQRFREAPPRPLAWHDATELIVVAAHPDDETLGCAGLIFEAAHRAMPVHVVIVTDGESSHPGSSSTTRDELRARRREESAAALSILAPGSRVEWIGAPDGAAENGTAELTAALDRLLDAAALPLVASVWSGDRHHDHRVVGDLVEQIAQRHGARHLAFPIWAWHWADPAGDALLTAALRSLELTPETRAAKRLAITQHRSQTDPLSADPADRAVLEPHVLEHFDRGAEVFIEVESTVDKAGAPREAVAREYFDDKYHRKRDPWGFETRWYERRKRALTLAMLTAPRYGRVLELGCALGTLTRELAERADAVLATDIAPEAVARALETVAGHPHVEVIEHDLAEGLPAGRFDLIVLSEIGYYLDAASLTSVAVQLSDALSDDGELLLCHWRADVGEHRLGGDDVHDIVRTASGLSSVSRVDDPDALIEVLRRDPLSVAQREGLRD
ncbi:bifunctional PIG-L family deacetylase/class I SAM-dependent methyltransferase [Schumannella soli]|uniref:Methyltransferase domain-containing protein n=1 Tax=Schumannella soli TaxID=2590779 RepID=A0A506Y4J9_9MICO|nr:bifunctional PIG-L family deacetylase/class I SAM-dependent methyltransferase [Schumannella soli]TPW77516.1 methyltransferase domain-containing protein [Schumannella soli]